MNFDDLIGTPYKLGANGPDRYDCGGLLECVLIRLGLIDDAYPDQPALDADGAHELGRWVDGWRSRLHRVGRGPENAGAAGDFTLSDPGRTGIGTHVSVLVDPTRRVWLTATKRDGVRTITERAITRPISTYRVLPR